MAKVEQQNPPDNRDDMFQVEHVETFQPPSSRDGDLDEGERASRPEQARNLRGEHFFLFVREGLHPEAAEDAIRVAISQGTRKFVLPAKRDVEIGEVRPPVLRETEHPAGEIQSHETSTGEVCGDGLPALAYAAHKVAHGHPGTDSCFAHELLSPAPGEPEGREVVDALVGTRQLLEEPLHEAGVVDVRCTVLQDSSRTGQMRTRRSTPPEMIRCSSGEKATSVTLFSCPS